MPILINEVIAEEVNTTTSESQDQAKSHTLPLSLAETALAQALEIIQQRQERLKID